MKNLSGDSHLYIELNLFDWLSILNYNDSVDLTHSYLDQESSFRLPKHSRGRSPHHRQDAALVFYLECRARFTPPDYKNIELASTNWPFKE